MTRAEPLSDRMAATLIAGSLTLGLVGPAAIGFPALFVPVIVVGVGLCALFIWRARAGMLALAGIAGLGGGSVLGAVLGLMLLASSGACVSRVELARVPSPDGVLDAVLVEADAGATVSFTYLVHVTRSGEEPRGNAAASFYRTDRRIDLRWQDAERLVVTHLAADITRLDAPTVEVAGRTVYVALNLGE